MLLLTLESLTTRRNKIAVLYLLPLLSLTIDNANNTEISFYIVVVELNDT